MVRNRPYEWNESARTVERVSPFCREGINVTQSRMSEDSDGRSGSNHHKYRNLNLSYEARPQQQNGQHGTLTAAFIHESMSREKLAECTSEAGLGHYAVITPSQPTTKKKTLHKIASGALANFGSLFGSGGEVADSRQLSGGNIKSNACTANADGLNLDFNDSGLQNKLSPKERFFSKPWKNRQKVIANVGSSLWVPEDDCLWTSVSGMKVYLTRLNLDELSRPEYVALRHISLAKLRKFHLRSNVIVPKDSHSTRKSLRRAFSLKNKASGINFFDKDKEKDTTGVFAIPLSKAVAQVVENNNEVLDEKVNRSKTSKTKSDSVDDRDGEPVEPLRARRHSSSSLSQSLRVTLMESAGEQSPSLGKHSQDSPKWKSRLMDALTLPSSSPSASSLMEKQMALIPMLPQVPLIVQKAIEHLECYGLHVLGIFRVGGSKKRMKQMREQFDSGERTDFTAEDNPHDVAALFKEYFRDLPEPLLTRDLYSAFLESQNEEDKKVQVLVLRLLCYLLPIPNRDTLKALLDFLAQVAHYSEDRQDEKGIQIPGNQMTSRNLATLMGPNILHKVKGQHYAFLVEDVARADERSEVIDVVQSMIEHRTELFEITADGHHEVLAQLLKSDPETVDLILKRRASRSKRASDEVDEVFFKIGESKRVRPLGEPERPLSRAASDPVSRPLLNSASVTPKSDNKNPRGSNSPVPPVRSHSLSQQETILYRNRAYNRMQSFPVENNGGTSSSLFHGSYRDNRRKTPPTMRAARVYRDTSSRETSEPPSPELSSTSRSIYSTPPSSPSGSTQYVSADSSLSHSPLEGSVFGEETPTKARLTCILNEVGVEVSCDQSTYSQNKPNTDFNHLVRGQDVQLEKWMQWESTTQQNGTQSELEQETLV